LLIERLGDVFESKKSMLQQARETVIAYQRLDAETQKKEILLSCIAEEMNSALANAITALRLIEMEKHSPRAQQLLTLAMRATEDQQALINKVLNVFAAELQGLYGREGDGLAASSLGEVLPEAAAAVSVSYAEKKVRLVLPDESSHTSKVAMGASHLARVFAGLLENALQNSAPGSEVRLAITEEADGVLFQVIDQGAALPAATGEDFFSKDVVATDETSTAQLRLQFCRIAVEKCQGEFGSEPGRKGGNRFWVRLPKLSSASAK
jgi:signal transduction histidine kinase